MAQESTGQPHVARVVTELAEFDIELAGRAERTDGAHTLNVRLQIVGEGMLQQGVDPAQRKMKRAAEDVGLKI